MTEEIKNPTPVSSSGGFASKIREHLDHCRPYADRQELEEWASAAFALLEEVLKAEHGAEAK